MLASVLHLSVENIEELFVLHVIDVRAPGVGKFKEGVLKLFSV